MLLLLSVELVYIAGGWRYPDYFSHGLEADSSLGSIHPKCGLYEELH